MSAFFDSFYLIKMARFKEGFVDMDFTGRTSTNRNTHSCFWERLLALPRAPLCEPCQPHLVGILDPVLHIRTPCLSVSVPPTPHFHPRPIDVSHLEWRHVSKTIISSILSQGLYVHVLLKSSPKKRFLG